MRTQDLINQLQALVDEHKASGAEEVMGEHEIMIDVFSAWSGNLVKYEGFSPNIEISYSDDGVYPIIAAKETWG